MHANKKDYKPNSNERNRLSPSEVFDIFVSNGVDSFYGVPDSLLKHFCAYVEDNAANHLIAANEGSSIGLAIGQYLATKKLPLVYMQNSGLGNAINPLLSLADTQVYGIPMILMLGWRGKPGVKDEPQHIKQGRVMLAMLESMEIPYTILSKNIYETEQLINKICKDALENEAPHALIVEKDTFAPYKLKNKPSNNFPLSRAQTIKIIIQSINKENPIISTTGYTSRELFEHRQELSLGHERDFLTVGGMGHASQISLGLSQHTNKDVYCIDGDGALLMHMGSLAINGQFSGGNFKHILINNGSHHSVGGQKTTGFDINFPEIAKSCGYNKVYSVVNKLELMAALSEINNHNDRTFLEIKVNLEVSDSLSRPSTTPSENKNALMSFLKK